MPQSPVEFTLPSVMLGAAAVEQTLDVPYLKQPASQWCWATSATMVSRFLFRTTVNICKVVSTLITDRDCCNDAPAGNKTANKGPNFWTATHCNRTVSVAEVAQLYTSLGIQSKHRGGKIDFETLCEQVVTVGSPVEVAFAWLGGGGHVAVVRGVSRDSQMVRINDPWPDSGEALIPFSQLESAYGRGEWFDCWTDLRKQQGGPSDGTV